ncbi:MAG: Gfo/Idh/MocA family oxidoreductase [Pleurocapsa minor GSE-CHR-MK-17-07R]|jgi:predicted dehydrogenase|nr:Gfo/Idh/MocA family oxidoreductase [Pleurocapsa minor GSE-CHR-MK 17-07R]
MSTLKFALFGTGFWSRYQLGGWAETGEVECVALYNRTKSRAEAVGRDIGVSAIYDDAERLLDSEKLDFVDICTNVETHFPLTKLAAERGIAVVCQKPMATSLAEAEALVAVCQQHNVPLYINENWRFQTPIRALKAALDSGRIGKAFRAVVDYRNSFDLYVNQPFLMELEQFILTDIGSHILDTTRYLFGEADTLHATIRTVNPKLKGEDVATCFLTMENGATVTAMMSYASKREHDRFPETYVQIEGDRGFLELGPDYWIRETTDEGTRSWRAVPPHYAWADARYDIVHSSIVPCQLNIARALKGLERGETSGEDNLKTVRLVFGSYASAASGQIVDRLALRP